MTNLFTLLKVNESLEWRGLIYGKIAILFRLFWVKDEDVLVDILLINHIYFFLTYFPNSANQFLANIDFSYSHLCQHSKCNTDKKGQISTIIFTGIPYNVNIIVYSSSFPRKRFLQTGIPLYRIRRKLRIKYSKCFTEIPQSLKRKYIFTGIPYNANTILYPF